MTFFGVVAAGYWRASNTTEANYVNWDAKRFEVMKKLLDSSYEMSEFRLKFLGIANTYRAVSIGVITLL
ncbi:hypothetical protein [Varibaculum massiliense]|uniref:hypothetical protein n=1 Tax=Varibaculum massiliense TaxID=1852372 RepID=UPI00288C4108|nr:hypothetical protein [Varibaculum massiliense]